MIAEKSARCSCSCNRQTFCHEKLLYSRGERIEAKNTASQPAEEEGKKGGIEEEEEEEEGEEEGEEEEERTGGLQCPLGQAAEEESKLCTKCCVIGMKKCNKKLEQRQVVERSNL
jgi:hypothetical protein